MKSRRDVIAVRSGVVVLVVIACLPAAAAAQTSQAQPQPPEKRWSLSLGIAGTAAGPDRQFEDAMRSSHLDDASWDFLGGGLTAHPYSRGGERFLEMDVTYRRNSRLAFGFVRSPAELRSTTGYHRGSEPHGGHFLTVLSKVTLLAPVAYLRLGKYTRVGAGPLAAWTEVVGLPHTTTFKSVTGGALAAAVLETSPTRATYLALQVSYRWIAPVGVGPFVVAQSAGPTATLPAMRVSVSHLSIGVNLGMRF